MLSSRLIPVLLLKNGGLVKTIKFSNPKYVGDPINAIRIFNEKEVDELMVLDIDASKNNEKPNFKLIEQFASECFMPLSYGGGIRNIADANTLFGLGVEKICVQSAAIENINIVSELSNRFGSSSVMVSIDIKKNWLRQKRLFCNNKNIDIAEDWLTFAREVESHGAGEIILNSVDNDGTMQGPDLNLITDASDALNIPLIAVGGIGSLDDIKKAIMAGASAVAAGSFFVFYGPHRAVLITYPKPSQIADILNKDEY